MALFGLVGPDAARERPGLGHGQGVRPAPWRRRARGRLHLRDHVGDQRGHAGGDADDRDH